MSLKLKDFFQVTDGDSKQPFNVTFKDVKELFSANKPKETKPKKEPKPK